LSDKILEEYQQLQRKAQIAKQKELSKRPYHDPREAFSHEGWNWLDNTIDDGAFFDLLDIVQCHYEHMLDTARWLPTGIISLRLVKLVEAELERLSTNPFLIPKPHPTKPPP